MCCKASYESRFSMRPLRTEPPCRPIAVGTDLQKLSGNNKNTKWNSSVSRESEWEVSYGPIWFTRHQRGALSGCPAHFSVPGPAFEGMPSAGVSITARHVIRHLCALRVHCGYDTQTYNCADVNSLCFQRLRPTMCGKLLNVTIFDFVFIVKMFRNA